MHLFGKTCHFCRPLLRYLLISNYRHLDCFCHTYSTSPRSLHTHIHYEFGALLGKYISAIPRAAQWAAAVISLAPASTNNSRSMSAFE